jgi:hypothetical protein
MYASLIDPNTQGGLTLEALPENSENPPDLTYEDVDPGPDEVRITSAVDTFASAGGLSALLFGFFVTVFVEKLNILPTKIRNAPTSVGVVGHATGFLAMSLATGHAMFAAFVSSLASEWLQSTKRDTGSGQLMRTFRDHGFLDADQTQTQMKRRCAEFFALGLICESVATFDETWNHEDGIDTTRAVICTIAVALGMLVLPIVVFAIRLYENGFSEGYRNRRILRHKANEDGYISPKRTTPKGYPFEEVRAVRRLLGELRVRACNATDLKDVGLERDEPRVFSLVEGPFLKAAIGGREVRSGARCGNLNPEWNEDLRPLIVYEGDEVLVISVWYEYGPLKQPDFMGSMELELDAFPYNELIQIRERLTGQGQGVVEIEVYLAVPDDHESPSPEHVSPARSDKVPLPPKNNMGSATHGRHDKIRPPSPDYASPARSDKSDKVPVTTKKMANVSATHGRHDKIRPPE